MVDRVGFEPTHPSLKRRALDQLGYRSKNSLFCRKAVGKRGADVVRRAKDEQVRCEPRYV